MSLKEKISSGELLFLDGGMGTMLSYYGADLNGAVNSLTHPEIVKRVHQDYLAAGANIMTSNTFAMNDIYIKTHSIGVDMQEVNTKGVILAREVAGEKAYVVGDMSGTGQMLKPYGDYEEDAFFESFLNQARVLKEAGVDGFLIETVFDVGEALLALKACKEICDTLPVMVSFSYTGSIDTMRIMMGQHAKEIAPAIEAAGGDVIGVNCGDYTPFDLAKVVTAYKESSDLPILVQPNAGMPKLKDGETYYDMEPKDFAEGLVACWEAGARIIGGCCGTTPAHIKAIVDALRG